MNEMFKGSLHKARKDTFYWSSRRRKSMGENFKEGKQVNENTGYETRIVNRLRRLEGQVRGLQRMILEDRSYHETLTLLAGVRNALDSTGEVILEAELLKGQGSTAARRNEVKGIISAVKLLRG